MAKALVSASLLTDLYQLTMAYGYWQRQMAEWDSVFQMTFRRNPFGGGFAIACGLADLLEQLVDFKFTRNDLDYLADLNGADGKPLFSVEFLGYLETMPFRCDIAAVPEGTVVFPHEPLVRVSGPLLQAQLIETLLLNVVNFPDVGCHQGSENMPGKCWR